MFFVGVGKDGQINRQKYDQLPKVLLDGAFEDHKAILYAIIASGYKKDGASVMLARSVIGEMETGSRFSCFAAVCQFAVAGGSSPLGSVAGDQDLSPNASATS